MPNRVIVNGSGCVEQIFEGDQSTDMLDEIIIQTFALQRDQRKAQKPSHLLININNMGNSSTEFRKVATDELKNLPFDKIAVFGQDIFKRTVANLMLQTSGQIHRVRIFRTRTDAEVWLLR